MPVCIYMCIEVMYFPLTFSIFLRHSLSLDVEEGWLADEIQNSSPPVVGILGIYLTTSEIN